MGSPTLDHLKNGIKRHGVVVVAEYENGRTSTSEDVLMLLECTQHTADTAIQKLREVRAMNDELVEALEEAKKTIAILESTAHGAQRTCSRIGNEEIQSIKSVLAKAKEQS